MFTFLCFYLFSCFLTSCFGSVGESSWTFSSYFQFCKFIFKDSCTCSMCHVQLQKSPLYWQRGFYINFLINKSSYRWSRTSPCQVKTTGEGNCLIVSRHNARGQDCCGDGAMNVNQCRPLRSQSSVLVCKKQGKPCRAPLAHLEA